MAKIERTLQKDFDALLARIENVVLKKSISACLKDRWDSHGAHSRCSVRVFERYSAFTSNQVSMNVTLYQEDGGPVELCAITSGSSDNILLRFDTLGEDTFLNTLWDALQ